MSASQTDKILKRASTVEESSPDARRNKLNKKERLMSLDMTGPNMSSSRSSLTEDLKCPVCLDVFTDPVTTSCGHNFCKTCLNKSWNDCQTCSCPCCKKTFDQRPDLKINTTLREISDHYKFKCAEKEPVVVCDLCEDRNAVKSCLVCQSSYCETHLEPHLKVTGLKKHKLMDPVSNLEDYICQTHQRPLELFCRDDQMSVCLECVVTDHKTHNTVPLEMESKEMKTDVYRLMETQKDVQQMIQDRNKKIQDINHSAEARRRVYTELLELMDKQQTAAEIQDSDQMSALEQEISELKSRNTELEQLSHTEDHEHLRKIRSSLYDFRNTRNRSEISLKTIENLKRALTQLRETIKEKLKQTELKWMQQYAVDVTLDPDTAHPELLLSDDRTQVRDGHSKQNLPDKPERFDEYKNVLGKEGFSSGRFYFEVKVKGKTDWTLGVARESVDRKGEIKLRPKAGYWTLALRDGSEYKARADPPVSLSLRVTPQRVGVFVDYEGGLVSFYEVESSSRIYSYTHQSFNEKLYPHFSPGFNREGKNSAPLIITPVSCNQ